MHLLVLVKSTTLEIRNDEFHTQVDHLGGDGKVDDLLAKAIRIDAPAWIDVVDLLLVLGERSSSQTEDVEERNYDAAEGDIDESGQEHGQV